MTRNFLCKQRPWAALGCLCIMMMLSGRSDADFITDVIDGAVKVADSVFEGAGALPGILFSAGQFYLSGPYGFVPALVEGKAVTELTNGLVKNRHPTDAEYAFALQTFHNNLPPKDRIFITNLSGLGNRQFTTVDKIIGGNYVINMGDGAKDPMSYIRSDSGYPAPGQVFIHEMTHVWQLYQASFQPAQVYKSIYTQVVDADLRGLGNKVYAYTCGMPWDGYNPEQQAHIVDAWFQTKSTCEYGYVVQNIRKERFTPRQSSSGGTMASVSRVPNSAEVWWIAPNGAVRDANWYDGGTWTQFELAPAGSASVNGAIAAVSRLPSTMDVWWLAPNGSVQGAFWSEGGKWNRYELAPAGSASVSGGITAVSRLPNTSEVWWTGADSSIQGAAWYDGRNWARYLLAPAGSAAQSGHIASVSRVPNSMELWWVGGNGSIQGAAWYEGGQWGRYELAPAGSATPSSGLAAVWRMPNSMEAWWVGANGSIQGSSWHEGGRWTPYELAPAGSAAAGSSIAALSRISTSMEVWWAGPAGNLQDAYWYDGAKWKRFELSAGDTPQSGGITASARLSTNMDVWTNGDVHHADGSWHTQTAGHYWSEGGNWGEYNLAYQAGPPLFSDLTNWFSPSFLYAVQPNGQLLWYRNLMGDDKRSPDPLTAGIAKFGISNPRPGIAPSPTTKPNLAKAQTSEPSAFQSVASVQKNWVYQWQGPNVVGSGWGAFKSIIPGGLAEFYALTLDGKLLWYRHDGIADGSFKWSGPLNADAGWSAFKEIVAMGEGVLYGIGTDGSLHWYRHTDVPSTRPAQMLHRWWTGGPSVVGTGWQAFTHVFASGQGVLYAITPDGKLLWYRHMGYLTGTSDWSGPSVVGTGWQNFTRVFSSGTGNIYAIDRDGNLYWYLHDGYLDGSSRWQNRVALRNDWGGFVNVFPSLGSPPTPVVIH